MSEVFRRLGDVGNGDTDVLDTDSRLRSGVNGPAHNISSNDVIGRRDRHAFRWTARREGRLDGRSGTSRAASRPTTRRRVQVPTYIMLTTLTPDGVQTIKNNPARIREVNREIEQLGATVKAQWATLGHFDFVNVIEAPDEKTIARVSLELGSRGTGKYETLVAIPIDDFIGAI
jgi:uncharacterized protein with GYD domain